MALTERDYLLSITRWLLRLDSWRNWVADVKWSTPEPGSELSGDDAADGLAWSPSSQIVASSIGAAVDHLQALRVLVVDDRQLFPFALQSLTRPALIGASQAVWILAPDDSQTRLERADAIRGESYRRHVQWLANQSSGHEQIRQHFEDRFAALSGSGGFILTDVINSAAEVAFSDRPDSDSLVQSTIAVWQRTSGAAHALPWAFANQPGTVTHDAGGKSELRGFVLGGSIEEIATSFNCAAMIVAKAWSLWYKRSMVKQPD